MKREIERERASGQQRAKFEKDGFDVVVSKKIDQLTEMRTNPKTINFVAQRLHSKHRRDVSMLADTRTGKVKNPFAVR